MSSAIQSSCSSKCSLCGRITAPGVRFTAPSRFVGPAATFEFVARTRDVTRLAGIPFDIRGAELGHRNGRCTFESLLEKYEMRDPALRRMARIIRGADLPHEDGSPPESAGVL